MITKLFKPFEELSKSQNNLISLGWLISILGLWIVTSLVGTTHLFPTISQVLEGFKTLWSTGLIPNIGNSLTLFLQALVYSTIISCGILYLSPLPIIRPVANIISTFRFLPLAGVSLYLSFMIHNARNVQVSVLVIFMSLFLITSLLKSISGIEDDINHAKTLGCNRWEILLEVIIKGRLDYVIEAIRQNLAIICAFLVFVELLNTTSGGLGLMIGNAQKNSSQGEMVAAQIIILLFGRLLDFSLTFIRKKAFKYSNF